MDKETRNRLRQVVVQCRRLLEAAVSELLEGQFGIHPGGKIEDAAQMGHLSALDLEYRQQVLVHLEHIRVGSYKPGESMAQLVREVAFTHLNRLVAYKMMERRGLIREAVSRGSKSQGFLFYLADHPEDQALWTGGKQDVAYRRFLEWLGRTFSEEIRPLFSPHDPANHLFPSQRSLDQVLELINDPELENIWDEDETIGWVYQYFTPKELRDQARKASQAPRNSYELSFRNQFYTPRYVVEFLTDNTLGRVWYEMREGETSLKERCRYLVLRPTEVFLQEGEEPPTETEKPHDDLSQQELLRQSVHIPHRRKRDPREIRVLDPACGSGHFLLYCFDLLQVIYEEAYEDPDLGTAMRKDFATLEDLRRAMPRLILRHNLHGIDIDLRATQIAALALWLRCQRVYLELGLKNGERPQITRSNIVCAEPMPGETDLLKEFAATLEPRVLGQLVEVVFEKMKLAGEAGSLLKIEEEIVDAIAEARKQWLKGPKPEQRLLFPAMADLRPKQQGPRFDLSGVTDARFWEQAEDRIIEALKVYARGAQNEDAGRRLFAEDAERGFSFVDVCRRDFDVVLMNPPFGLSAKGARLYLESAYGVKRQDLSASFVSRWQDKSERGCVGAVLTRNVFYLSSYSSWRTKCACSDQGVTVMVDLGQGVLDTAMVETAAAVFGNYSNANPSLFFDIHQDESKKRALADQVTSVRATNHVEGLHAAATSSFLQIPTASFCYWVSDRVRSLFTTHQSFEDSGNEAWVGLQTNDDFRWIRLWWEVPACSHGRKRQSGHLRSWVPYSKGGDFASYYGYLHLVVDWTNDGDLIKKWKEEEVRAGKITPNNSKCWNESKYFQAAVTWTQRSQLGLGVRAFPAGSVFGIKGPAAFAGRSSSNLLLLGLMNSSPFRGLVSLHMAFGSYDTGVIRRTPVPEIDSLSTMSVEQRVRNAIIRRRALATYDETSHVFLKPIGGSDSLSELTTAYAREYQTLEQLDTADQVAIDALFAKLYGLSDAELAALTKRILVVESETVSDSDATSDASVEITHQMVAQGYMSHSIGCVLGRWDMRFSTSERQPPDLPDPFAPLPICPPGMLQGQNGLPAKPEDVPSDYPLRINWDGILVDDPEHEDDIVRRVRDVLEVIWKDRAEAIKKEACEIVGVRELRDYFRKRGSGGYWMDHVRRYSKSRRKAPTYWYLRSSKGNYGLWLYYHRLDKDIYFKALVNYVEPKLRLEETRLGQLRRERAQSGTGGREAKQMERKIDKQEAFLSELRGFHDKLRRVADLNLVPNLNDGVILNIAPLWELVPWKEAKKTWEQLLDGKHEWSSIGKQLRAKGIVKA